MATISTQQAQVVSCLQRPQGRQKLLEALQWEQFDEDSDFQRGILLDFHYDNLMYCVQKGFPWQHACILVDMAATILSQSTGKSIAEAIKIYHQESQKCCCQLGEEHLKLFTEHFFETFMKHYKLFQYVYSTEREELIVKTDLNVETSSELLPFTDSKDVTIWDYEQKIKEIEDTAEKRKSERESEREEECQEREANLQDKSKALHSEDGSFEREALVKLINDIASTHVTAATHAIKGKISETMEELDFMLQKTVIPRPQLLGPPPRYKTKTPLAAGKRPISTKEKVPKSGKSRAQSGARSVKGK